MKMMSPRPPAPIFEAMVALAMISMAQEILKQEKTKVRLNPPKMKLSPKAQQSVLSGRASSIAMTGLTGLDPQSRRIGSTAGETLPGSRTTNPPRILTPKTRVLIPRPKTLP